MEERRLESDWWCEERWGSVKEGRKKYWPTTSRKNEPDASLPSLFLAWHMYHPSSSRWTSMMIRVPFVNVRILFVLDSSFPSEEPKRRRRSQSFPIGVMNDSRKGRKVINHDNSAQRCKWYTERGRVKWNKYEDWNEGSESCHKSCCVPTFSPVNFCYWKSGNGTVQVELSRRNDTFVAHGMYQRRTINLYQGGMFFRWNLINSFTGKEATIFDSDWRHV